MVSLLSDFFENESSLIPMRKKFDFIFDFRICGLCERTDSKVLIFYLIIVAVLKKITTAGFEDTFGSRLNSIQLNSVEPEFSDTIG